MTRLTLTLDCDLSDKEKEQLPQLLRDALGEFYSARSSMSVAYYVGKRYPDMSDSQRAAKQREVESRIELAHKLKLISNLSIDR